MRIGYFITHFPYSESPPPQGYIHGGAEISVSELARQMAGLGHEIKVFTTASGAVGSTSREGGLQVFRYGTGLRIGGSNIALGLFRQPMAHHLDLIHANFSTPPGELAALRYATKKTVPLLLTYHGDWQHSFGNPLRRAALFVYNRLILPRLLERTNVIVCHSPYYVQESRYLGRYRGKVVVLPSGIDTSQFDIPLSREACREELGWPSRESVLLFVGNLTPYKGPEVLLRALPHLLAHGWPVRLVFVGRGILRPQLEALARALGVAGSVEFAGFVSEERKPLYYRAADVLALPSTMNTEVFPRVFLEAAAAGLPLVVSDLATFGCIVQDGDSGLVTPQGDPQALAGAIQTLFQDDSLRARLARVARQRVEEYSWPRVAQQTEKLYQQVLDQ